MLEISNKKAIITRKEHTCYLCNTVIEKGAPAVAASAQEDDKRCRLHFHIECSARHARAIRAINEPRSEMLLDSEYPF